MEELFDERVQLRPRRRGAELYHWLAMKFGKHWWQRIGVAFASASAAARTGSSTSSAGAAESSPYLV